MELKTWELLFPAHAQHPLRVSINIALLYRQLINILRLRRHKIILARHGEQAFQGPIDKADWFYIFNGLYSREQTFQNKYLFGNLVQTMGYRAPRSVIVPAKGSLEEFRPLIENLRTDDEQRFCKPLWGVFGRGAVMKPAIEETMAYLREQSVDYLVQTFEKPQQDWRYILHRDMRQVHASEPPRWRMAIEKVRPVVIGDGISTINELYARQTSVPIRYRQNYLKNKGKNEGTRVPTLNETVQLLDAANMAQGAYPSVPSGQVLSTLDQFFLRFLSDVEGEVGYMLGSFAVDIGVTDTSIFHQPYNHEQVKKSIVFYEYQLPFTLKTYTYSPALFEEFKRTGDMKPFAPPKILCKLRRAKAHAVLFTSMLLTGALLQKKHTKQSRN